MRFPTLFACAAALLLISAGASHAAAPAITGEMQKKYESMQSFTAEFTQRLVHQESGSEETRQGTLAFQKPLRVRWETKAPRRFSCFISFSSEVAISSKVSPS